MQAPGASRGIALDVIPSLALRACMGALHASPRREPGDRATTHFPWPDWRGGSSSSIVLM